MISLEQEIFGSEKYYQPIRVIFVASDRIISKEITATGVVTLEKDSPIGDNPEAERKGPDSCESGSNPAAKKQPSQNRA